MVNLNYDKMREICLAPLSYFWELGRKIEINGRWYVFIDNGGSTLGVAHLDSVISNANVKHFHVSKYNAFLAQYISTIYNAQLDDRLGAYIILDLLPRHIGKSYDILLCNDEESGRSTASLFDAKTLGVENRYNWIFEFDATGGSDAKTYSYGDTELHDKLKEHGFTPAHGSYTDICHLTSLGVKAMNIACGYYQYHSQTAYALVQDIVLQVERFLSFYSNYHAVKLPHTPKQFVYRDATHDWRDQLHSWTDGTYKQEFSDIYRSTRTSKGVRDERPNNFDWLNDPNSYYKYSIVKGNQRYETFDHKASGNQAAYCMICGKPHWVDDLDFVEMGSGVCDFCAGTKGATFTDDDLVWLTEGGLIIRDVQDDLWQRRVFSWTEKETFFICPVCGEAEWESDKSPDGVCRVCVEFLKDDQKIPTNELHRILPDGTEFVHSETVVKCAECDKLIDLSTCTIEELEAFDSYNMCEKCVAYYRLRGLIT